MNSNIKISIILPVYNTPFEILKSCIDSVIQQTNKNYELIVIDDGSNAKCAHDIETLCLGIPNTIIIHKKNEGVSNARNDGIRIATGEYLIFLDSDNTLPINSLHVLSNSVTSKTDLIIGFSVMGYRKIINGIDDIYLLHTQHEFTDTITEISDKNELVTHLLTGQVDKFKLRTAYFSDGPWGKLYRTDIAKFTPFKTELKWNEDTVWLLEYISKVSNIYLLESVIYNNIEYQFSATRRFRQNCFNEFFDICKAESEMSIHFPECKHAFVYKSFMEILLVCKLYLFHEDSTVQKTYDQFKFIIRTPEVQDIINNIMTHLKSYNVRFILAKMFAILIKMKLYKLCFLILKFYTKK